MKKSSLIQVLSVFSATEIKEFEDYVRSPFLNKNRTIVKLYEYIKQQYPGFEHNKISKNSVWSAVFPGTAYNDGLLRIYMFNLTNLALDYLLYKEQDSDKFAKGNHMLRMLNTRNLNKQFEKTRKQLLREYKGSSLQSELYNYNRYNFEFENMYYLHKRYFDKSEKLVEFKGVQNIIYYATVFQIIVMLKSYLYFLNTKQLYETDTDIEEFELFLRNLDISKYTSSPIVLMLYQTIKLHTDEDNELHFTGIRDNLFRHFNEIHFFDSLEIIINMENYCKRMIRKGKNEYNDHLFGIYCFELENKTYKLEHFLSEKMFNNITETALNLGKFEWAASFIKNYKKELDETIREAVYNFNMAAYEFSLGNFESAIEFLLKTGRTDVYNKFEIRNLLIACYYELDMFDNMEGVIDSYRHLLSSDKYISRERKKYYSNFILIAKKLIRLKTHYSQDSANKLREMLKQPGFVIDVKWLEKKISEAENRNIKRF